MRLRNGVIPGVNDHPGMPRSSRCGLSPPPPTRNVHGNFIAQHSVRLRACIATRLMFRFVGIVCVTSGPVSCAVDWVFPQLNVRQLGLSTIKCATLRVRSTPLTIKRLHASVVKEPTAGVSLHAKALHAMISRSLYFNFKIGRSP